MPDIISTSLRDILRGSCLNVFLAPRLALVSLAIFGGCVAVRAQDNSIVQPAQSSVSILDSTREQDGLLGPVRRVYTEMTKASENAGGAAEGPRMLLEITTYDPQGKRIWNVYYPIGTGSFKGNQELAYDEQGHVKEMTLRDDAGHILSREAYTYEFDSFGNWTRMSSSLVIFEAGKIVYEPFEVAYRTIAYYYDDSVAQIVKSSASTSTPPIVTPSDTAVDKSKTTGGVTTSVDTPDITKPKSSTGSTDNALAKPANTLPNANAKTDEVKQETPGDNGVEGKREVDVIANPTTQAYQMPEQPIAKDTSSKQTVSGGVVHGKVLSLPKPVYPAVAMARGVLGRVVVEVTLDEQGRVVDARALSGSPVLRASAVAAARLARFEPTLLSGQPVKATRLIDYDFRK